VRDLARDTESRRTIPPGNTIVRAERHRVAGMPGGKLNARSDTVVRSRAGV